MSAKRRSTAPLAKPTCGQILGVPVVMLALTSACAEPDMVEIGDAVNCEPMMASGPQGCLELAPPERVAGLSVGSLTQHDLDLDGDIDLLSSDGYMLLLEDDHTIRTVRVPGFSDAWTDAQVGDYEGDGIPDVFARADDHTLMVVPAPAVAPGAPLPIPFENIYDFDVVDVEGDASSEVAAITFGPYAAGLEDPYSHVALFGRRRTATRSAADPSTHGYERYTWLSGTTIWQYDPTDDERQDAAPPNGSTVRVTQEQQGTAGTLGILVNGGEQEVLWKYPQPPGDPLAYMRRSDGPRTVWIADITSNGRDEHVFYYPHDVGLYGHDMLVRIFEISIVDPMQDASYGKYRLDVPLAASTSANLVGDDRHELVLATRPDPDRPPRLHILCFASDDSLQLCGRLDLPATPSALGAVGSADSRQILAAATANVVYRIDLSLPDSDHP